MFDPEATIAFDWNTGAIGVLDVYADNYRCFPYAEMESGALLIFDHPGTLVSFNGSVKDIDELRKLVGDDERKFVGEHFDMLDETSKIRWPPKPGTLPIYGKGLKETYEFFGGAPDPAEPMEFESGYFRKVWFDCYRAGYLYRAWVEGKLTSRGLGA